MRHTTATHPSVNMHILTQDLVSHLQVVQLSGRNSECDSSEMPFFAVRYLHFVLPPGMHQFLILR